MEIDKNDVVATAASSSGEPRNSKERVAANNAANTDEGGVSNAGDVQPSKKPRLNEETPQESKGKERKTAKDKEELEDMEWVCALCKEAECLMQPNADEFLICDGGCERVFHYPCAGLSQIPDQNQDWMCQDCTQGRHLCAFCHEYGQDGVDVFMCQKTKCGLYFHESCLALNNVPVTMQESTIVSQGEDGDGAQHSPKSVEANPLGNETVTLSVPVFTCPAHRCWTCTQDEERQKEQEKVDAEKLKKKKKRGKKPKSIFMCKTEGRLFVSTCRSVMNLLTNFGH